MNANMQFTINSFRQLFRQDFFRDISLIFSKIPDISPTVVKFPDISRFSRQVVTLLVAEATASDSERLKLCTTKKNAIKTV